MLAEFTGEGKYRDFAKKSLRLVVGMETRYPTAFGRWLSAADMALENTKQIAVVYEAGGLGDAEKMIRVVQSRFRPNIIVATSAYPPPEDAPALLRDRPLKDGKPTIYVCEGFICKNPVTAISELEKIL